MAGWLGSRAAGQVVGSLVVGCRVGQVAEISAMVVPVANGLWMFFVSGRGKAPQHLGSVWGKSRRGGWAGGWLAT